MYIVSQDGADFYMRCMTGELAVVVTCPAGCKDFDMEAALYARAWFEKLMGHWTVSIKWEEV